MRDSLSPWHIVEIVFDTWSHCCLQLLHVNVHVGYFSSKKCGSKNQKRSSGFKKHHFMISSMGNFPRFFRNSDSLNSWPSQNSAIWWFWPANKIVLVTVPRPAEIASSADAPCCMRRLMAEGELLHNWNRVTWAAGCLILIQTKAPQNNKILS